MLVLDDQVLKGPETKYISKIVIFVYKQLFLSVFDGTSNSELWHDCILVRQPCAKDHPMVEALQTIRMTKIPADSFQVNTVVPDLAVKSQTVSSSVVFILIRGD